MQTLDLNPSEPVSDRETLEQQIRNLQERLAFYEGFDLLIQDNVTQSRELFRRAAQEREAAAAAAEQIRHEAGLREAQLREELKLIAEDLSRLSHAVDALTDRVTRVLGEPDGQPGPSHSALPAQAQDEPLAVVVHGVPSAAVALSLQRFVASLPQVSAVTAREFVGGVLYLDARVRDRLQAAQFRTWADPRRVEALTDRPEVIELELHEPVAMGAGA